MQFTESYACSTHLFLFWRFLTLKSTTRLFCILREHLTHSWKDKGWFDLKNYILPLLIQVKGQKTWDYYFGVSVSLPCVQAFHFSQMFACFNWLRHKRQMPLFHICNTFKKYTQTNISTITTSNFSRYKAAVNVISQKLLPQKMSVHLMKSQNTDLHVTHYSKFNLCTAFKCHQKHHL